MSRLRHRPMISNLEELKGLKNELALKRVEVAKYNKSKEWKLEDLLAILSSLNKHEKSSRTCRVKCKFVSQKL